MTVSWLPWDVQWRYHFSKVKQIWKIITMCCTVCMDYFPSYIYIYIYTHRKRSFSLSIPCFLFISFKCHCPWPFSCSAGGIAPGSFLWCGAATLYGGHGWLASHLGTPGWGGFLWRLRTGAWPSIFWHIMRYILIPVLDIIWLVVIWLVVWNICSFDNICE